MMLLYVGLGSDRLRCGCMTKDVGYLDDVELESMEPFLWLVINFESWIDS